MKKMKRTVTDIALAMVLGVSFIGSTVIFQTQPVHAELSELLEQEIRENIWFGEHVRGNLKYGVLTISGTGEMEQGALSGLIWPEYQIEEVIIEDGVTNIADNTFEGCRKLTSIEIPTSVTSIGRYTFTGCERLNSITIPNSVTSIGDYAFEECIKLSSITIPNSVAEIGEWVFRGIESLKKITNLSQVDIDLKKQIEGKGTSAFMACPEFVLEGTDTVVDVVKQGQTVVAKQLIAELRTSLVLNKSKAVLGEQIIATATASGGTGDYTYKYLLYNPTSKEWTQLQDYTDKNTYTWMADGVGARHIYVEVKDSNGTVTRSKAYGVTVENKPIVTAKISTSKARIGDKVTVTANAREGSGVYTYRYLLYNPTTRAWTQLQGFADKNTYVWTANGIGARHLYVEVRDSNGTVTRSKAYGVMVENKPIVTAKISTSKAGIGDKVTVTANAKEGSGVYTYRYLLYNPTTKTWTQLQEFTDKNTYVWTANGIGARHLYVEVKDSNGSVTRSKAYGVTVFHKPIIASKISSSKLAEGNKVTITATAREGSGRYAYRYIMYNPATKVWTQLQPFGAKNTYTWTASGIGVRHLFAEVKDSNGMVTRSKAYGVTIIR